MPATLTLIKHLLDTLTLHWAGKCMRVNASFAKKFKYSIDFYLQMLLNLPTNYIGIVTTFLVDSGTLEDIM